MKNKAYRGSLKKYYWHITYFHKARSYTDDRSFGAPKKSGKGRREGKIHFVLSLLPNSGTTIYFLLNSARESLLYLKDFFK